MTSHDTPQQSDAPTDPPGSLPTHYALLGSRLYLHTYIRLFVVVTIIVGALVAQYLVGIEDLKERYLYALAGIIAIYNAGAWLIARHHRQLQRTPAGYRRLAAVMYVAVVADFLSLTVATWLVGGTRSPFLVFYLVHAMLSCVLLSRPVAITFSALAYALLTGLVLGESFGIIPPQQPIGAIAGTGPLDARYALTVLVVYGMLFALTAFLLLTLAQLMRQGEKQLREANSELERLSNMRRDFLHIALHNLQSPVGASTMFLKNLRDGLAGPLTARQAEWVDRALGRLDGMTDFVTDLQILATLESDRLDAHTTHLDVAAILRSVVDEYHHAAEAHHHKLRLRIPADLPPVRGIERLLREAVVNYLSNAIKYTPDGGRITVRAVNDPPAVRIEVEDNGIGISVADQNRLFNEFVRISRDDAPLGKVSGSGLGLSIVRRVVEAHHGRIYVISALNRGSTFIIELPAATP